MVKLKLKKGDEVIIATGKDRGKRGKIIKILPSVNKAIVAGINVVKKHTKPTQTTQGGIISKELPINISNIAYFDSEANGPTKIGFKFLEDGSKVRFSKKSGKVIKEGM
jgi:large subunit ribosomal protein L24